MRLNDFGYFILNDIVGDDNADATSRFEGCRVNRIPARDVGEEFQGGRQLDIGKNLSGGDVGSQQRLIQRERGKGCDNSGSLTNSWRCRSMQFVFDKQLFQCTHLMTFCVVF